MHDVRLYIPDADTYRVEFSDDITMLDEQDICSFGVWKKQARRQKGEER